MLCNENYKYPQQIENLVGFDNTNYTQILTGLYIYVKVIYAYMNIKTWRQNKKGKIIENWLQLFQIQFFNSKNFHNFRTYYLIQLYIYTHANIREWTFLIIKKEIINDHKMVLDIIYHPNISNL